MSHQAQLIVLSINQFNICKFLSLKSTFSDSKSVLSDAGSYR